MANLILSCRKPINLLRIVQFAVIEKLQVDAEKPVFIVRRVFDNQDFTLASVLKNITLFAGTNKFVFWYTMYKIKDHKINMYKVKQPR